MRLAVGILTILLLFSLSTVQAQNSPYNDLEGSDFNFRINLSADYTNHIDQSMLLTVEGISEEAFAIRDSGSNISNAAWLSGVHQIFVENQVFIGKLHDSGFDASSNPKKVASVAPFNITSPSPANYSDFLDLELLAFVPGVDLSVTLVDNSTVSSPFVTIPAHFFVIDEAAYLNEYDKILDNLTKAFDSSFTFDTELKSDSTSLTYSLSGSMLDIHQFTYHPRKLVDRSGYNSLNIEAGISIVYEDNVLSEYEETYEIAYADTTIMQYSYSINVRSGSIGNNIIGGTPPPLGIEWPYLIIGAVVLIFATRYLTKRYG